MAQCPVGLRSKSKLKFSFGSELYGKTVEQKGIYKELLGVQS